MLEFKPLKQKRGSILLIVVSMMSVLIMLAQALLLSVSVTRQTQVTNFYDKQAYQTSLSITDIIAAELMKGQAFSTSILSKLSAEGNTVSTGPNGFAALGAIDGAEQLNKVGAYRVDITRKADTPSGDGANLQVFEIAVLTDFNGMQERVSSTIYLKETKAKLAGFDRMFTATGYATGDVFINNSFLFNPAYFDNEYTVVTSEENKTAITFANIICGGTFQVESTNLFSDQAQSASRDLIVRNDLNIFNSESSIELKMHGGQVYVGGNLNVKAKSQGKILGGTSAEVKGDGYNVARSTSVFVLGDINAESKLSFQGVENVYVAGNVYAPNSIFINDNSTNIYIMGDYVGQVDGNGKVYYGGNAYRSDGKTPNTDTRLIKSGDSDVWKASSSVPLIKTIDNKLSLYTSEDGSTVYNINVSNVRTLINELTEERAYPRFSPSEQGATVVKPKFDGDNYTCYIDASDPIYNKGAIIEDIKFGDKSYSGSSNAKNIIPTFIIENNETEMKDGKEVPKPFTILLKANDSDSFYWGGKIGQDANVIILGTSPVFFEVEQGTTYQMNNSDFVGHYGWYKAIQDIDDKIGDQDIYKNDKEAPSDKSTWVSSRISNTQQPKQPTDKVSKYLLGLVYTEEDEKDDPKHVAGSVNPAKLQAMDPSFIGDPEIMNIHNNVYLISDDENARINMTGANCFYAGFVYAPYMTYTTLEGAGAGMAIAGGLIVSDYILDDLRGYMFFKPSIDISDLFEEYLTPITKREWKTALYG